MGQLEAAERAGQVPWPQLGRSPGSGDGVGQRDKLFGWSAHGHSLPHCRL